VPSLVPEENNLSWKGLHETTIQYYSLSLQRKIPSTSESIPVKA